MVVIDDHDMIIIGEGSIPKDVVETGEGSIPTDVLDVGEGSNTRAHEEIDNESYRYDPDFAPTPNGTQYWRLDLPKDEKPKLGDIFNTFVMVITCTRSTLRKACSTFVSQEADADDEEKDGPTLASRLKVALMGGYDKVRGTPVDYRNFKHRDAQIIVGKMINRQLHVLEFSFEHHVLHDELVIMLWADDTMKCSNTIFGDVVSFDATFRTTKHDFVFVPFTGIDHNKKCVTFGADLLSDETEDSYCWMLKDFLKVKEMKKQLEVEMQSSNYDYNKEALYADLLGVTVPEQVVIKNPKKSSNKGSKRRKNATEIVKDKKKPRTTRKVPFKHRTCNKCGGKGHNRCKCTRKKVMKEDEIQDVDEVYESDEDNM
nr:protein FAR1-related sequence 5-like [Tanacetum cinerariifolium]